MYFQILTFKYEHFVRIERRNSKNIYSLSINNVLSIFKYFLGRIWLILLNMPFERTLFDIQLKVSGNSTDLKSYFCLSYLEIHFKFDCKYPFRLVYILFTTVLDEFKNI